MAKARFSGGDWPNGSELRELSVRRRKRRLEASGFAVLGLVVAVAITSAVLVGPGSTHNTPAQAGKAGPTGGHIDARIGSAVELTSLVEQIRTLNQADEAKVANAEEQFSLKILGQLVDGSSDSNQLVSPFSLAETLAMAQLGASGQTAAQLSQALGSSNLSVSQRALGWASLDDDLVTTAADDRIALKNANSIWTQKGFPIQAVFLNDLKSEFGAGVWQANFAKNPTAAVNSVNAWVSQATDGLIPSLLQPSDAPSLTAAVLLNAVLFEAQWATQLTSTMSGPFDAPGGSVPVTYMSPSGQDTEYLSSLSSGLDAIELPYWNGAGPPGTRPRSRYAALVLMPTSGSLTQFVNGLDATGLNRIVNGMTDQMGGPQIPECKIGSTLQLVPALEALGVKDAFGPSADFSGLSSIATQISEVKQQATLRISKWGTVAAAATAAVFEATAAHLTQQVIINRPFLFMIRDTKTGAILFESAVDNPSVQN